MLRLHAAGRATDPIPVDVIAAGAQAPLAAVPAAEDIRNAVWIDLAYPLAHERQAVEAALGLELPTKADMNEIEASSRIYREGRTQVMNVVLVVGLDSDSPAAAPVSLILTPTQLITVRYADPTAFRQLDQACVRSAVDGNPMLLLVRLLENIVDRIADALERMGSEIDSLSSLIFGRNRPKSTRLSTEDLQGILRRIGTVQFVINKLHESLVTLLRAISFVGLSAGIERAAAEGSMDITLEEERAPVARTRPSKLVREALKSLTRDIMSLSENANYLTQNVGFMLDAALGRIAVEQSAIIKIFSVAAVVLLPPTMVASVYGMNFAFMPELEWKLGYPFALLLMVASAVVPYLWFKRKGWL